MVAITFTDLLSYMMGVLRLSTICIIWYAHISQVIIFSLYIPLCDYELCLLHQMCWWHDIQYKQIKSNRNSILQQKASCQCGTNQYICSRTNCCVVMGQKKISSHEKKKQRKNCWSEHCIPRPVVIICRFSRASSSGMSFRRRSAQTSTLVSLGLRHILWSFSLSPCRIYRFR